MSKFRSRQKRKKVQIQPIKELSARDSRDFIVNEKMAPLITCNFIYITLDFQKNFFLFGFFNVSIRPLGISTCEKIQITFFYFIYGNNFLCTRKSEILSQASKVTG